MSHITCHQRFSVSGGFWDAFFAELTESNTANTLLHAGAALIILFECEYCFLVDETEIDPHLRGSLKAGPVNEYFKLHLGPVRRVTSLTCIEREWTYQS